MKTTLLSFLIFFSFLSAFPQEKAVWIWYPGDFEVWLQREVGGRRQERGQPYPPFWRIDSPYGLVSFQNTFEVPEPETIKIYADGRYSLRIDGNLISDFDPMKLIVPSGKHQLLLLVENYKTFPSILIEGKTIRTGKQWLVTNQNKTYFSVDAGDFYDPMKPPATFSLEYTPITAKIIQKQTNKMLLDFGKETFGKVIVRNANLVSIIPTLELKMGFVCVGEKNLRRLREISLVTDDLANQRVDAHQPYVGKTAFTHKAGMHVNAVQKNAKTFEHIAPEQVGNQRHVLISELSGASNVLMKAQELGIDVAGITKEDSRAVLEELKVREHNGYSYESADGSFKIMLQKVLHKHKPFFELEGFRVIVEKRGREEPCISEATIKVKVGDETELTAGEGHGPVDALNAALRAALTRFYPEIADIALTDYRVRILDPKLATRAMTRVVIESGDGKSQWGTVGVSENIIEASWQALLDSVEHKLFEVALEKQ